MKKTKVLVPALGILCLSMAASITGTVAWFSANAQVTANGMKLAASTDTSLAIANENTGTWGNDITLDAITARNVMPVSPLIYKDASTKLPGCSVENAASVGTEGVDHIDWYKKGSDNQVVNPTSHAAAVTFPVFAATDLASAGESTYVKEGDFALATSNYVMDSAHIKLMAAAGTTQKVTLDMTVTSASNTGEKIDKAFHIGFLFKRNGASAVNNPTTGVAYGAEADGNSYVLADKTFLDHDLSSFTATPAAEGGHCVYTKQVSAMFELEAEKPVEVVIYGWYEGEDADCTSANATIVNQLTVDLAFSKYVAAGGLK